MDIHTLSIAQVCHSEISAYTGLGFESINGAATRTYALTHNPIERFPGLM